MTVPKLQTSDYGHSESEKRLFVKVITMAAADEIENATPPASSTNSDGEAPATGTHGQLTFKGPKDPANPKNWSLFRRLFITFIWIAGNLVASVSSSIFSSGAQAISEEFHVGTEVVTLGVSLFVIVS